jgi:hypothetical protein
MSTISPEVIVRGFKKGCMSDEMDGREDEEEVGYVSSKHDCEQSM